MPGTIQGSLPMKINKLFMTGGLSEIPLKRIRLPDYE